MNSETKKQTADTIKAINEKIVKKMMSEEKNHYDREVQLPDNTADNTVESKRKYNRQLETKCEEQNSKRRKSRPSTLEQCIIEGKTDEAEKRIQKMHYTTITALSQNAQEVCNEKTARKIIKELLKMIGYETDTIPTILEKETIKCIEKWLGKATVIYNYNRGKIKPLDMNQEEMILTYYTYKYVKTIILINSNSKSEYDEAVGKLDKKLNPTYAAIRALEET